MKKWLLAVAMLAACDDASSGPVPGRPSGAHGHSAPHGGALVELGDHVAQVEFVRDGKKLIAYVLDGHAEKSVRIGQMELVVHVVPRGAGAPIKVTLAAVGSSLTGEKPGDTPQFEAAFDGPKEWDGLVEAVKVKGLEFKSVKFKYPEGG
jgi:hypothetical protein